MTAEIAVLNKHGVALAADSAVTIGENSKVYNSANKLFQLSKHHPIGIMVYGNAEFMGVPWEIIIKQYRNVLDRKSFGALREYANDFFSYLAAFDTQSHNNEKSQIETDVKDYFSFLKNEIVNAIKIRIESDEKVTNESTEYEVNRVIQAELDLWTKAELLANFPEEFPSEFIKQHSKEIKKSRVQI